MDWLIEHLTAGIGRAFWREMKRDAARCFRSSASSAKAVKALLSVNEGLQHPYKFHLVGHSAGSNFVCEFMHGWARLAIPGDAVDRAFLLGAACTVSQYETQLLPALEDRRLRRLTTYNLTEERETKDTVGPYSKSLLYLVSNAFEEAKAAPILGMEMFSQRLKAHTRHEILYAGRDAARTDASTHGGYGTDLKSLNDVLKQVLGNEYKPSLAFRQEELDAA